MHQGFKCTLVASQRAFYQNPVRQIQVLYVCAFLCMHEEYLLLLEGAPARVSPAM